MVNQIIKYLTKDTVAFQVALQTLEINPKNLKRMVETGFALYRGGEKAKNPLFLHVEPTGACNLKCPMCPRTESITRKLSNMKFEKFKKIVDSIDPIFVAFVGFGEPLLCPDILKMVSYSVDNKRTTRISTNATFLTSKLSKEIIKTGLQQIWFSIDSPSPENFAKIRVGAEFEETINKIKEFASISKTENSKIAMTVNYTITLDNIHEVPKMVAFCHSELGIKTTFARGYSYDIEEQKQRSLSGSIEVLSYLNEAIRTAKINKQTEIENNLKTLVNDLKYPLDGAGPCYFPYYVVAVSWDGKVNPCCLFYDYQMNFGNVNEKEFDEIWNGAAYQNFRINLKQKREKINICNTCTLNDISIHNVMHKITKFPGTKLLTKEKYNFIDRHLK